MRYGYFPGKTTASHLNNSIVIQDSATGKTIGQLIPTEMNWNWSMLALGEDGRNYLLMLAPGEHVNVYRCPEP